MKSAASWLEVQLLIALALAAQGKVRRALKILGVVLARAEPEGYLRLFADEGQPLARLLALVSFLAALDQTIVATALPTIVGELHGFSSYAWVGTAYLLTMTTMIPLVGKLSDQFGRKWLLLVGIVLFLLGAALAGLIHCHRDDRDDSWTADWRAITEHTSWRWIFYLNLLLGMVALACIAIWLPASISVRATRVWGRAGLWRLDLPGSLTAAAATVCLLLGLSWGGETYPWASVQVVGLLVAAALLPSALPEKRARRAEPRLQLSLLRNGIFATALFLAFAYGLIFFGILYYSPLFIQSVLGQTSLSSSAALTPLLLGVTVGSIAGGLLVSRLKRYRIVSLARGTDSAGGRGPVGDAGYGERAQAREGKCWARRSRAPYQP